MNQRNTTSTTQSKDSEKKTALENDIHEISMTAREKNWFLQLTAPVSAAVWEIRSIFVLILGSVAFFIVSLAITIVGVALWQEITGSCGCLPLVRTSGEPVFSHHFIYFCFPRIVNFLSAGLWLFLIFRHLMRLTKIERRIDFLLFKRHHFSFWRIVVSLLLIFPNIRKAKHILRESKIPFGNRGPELLELWRFLYDRKSSFNG